MNPTPAVTDQAPQANFLPLRKNQLIKYRAKLQANREALGEANPEQVKALLAMNDELSQMVEELLLLDEEALANQNDGKIAGHRENTAREKIEEERVQLIHDLENERNLWQTMVESMLDPVTVCDAQGRAIYMNQVCANLIQMEIHEDVEMEQQAGHYHLHRPDGTPIESNELPLQRATFENIHVKDVEILHHSKDGKKYTLIWNAAPLHDASGSVIGGVAVGRDVTKQRETEAANARLLEENQRRKEYLENTFATGPFGIAILSAPNFTAQISNPTYQALTPHPEIDPVGKRVEEVWKPEEGFDVVPLLASVLQNDERIRSFNLDKIFPDGSRRIYSFHIQSLLHGGKKRLLLVIWDITEIELAREEAEEGRRTLEAIMEYIPEGITIADAPDARVRMISRHGSELIGLGAEEIVGRPRSGWWKIYHPGDGTLASVGQMPLSRAIWNGETITDEEWLLENARGEQLSILSNAGPIRNQDGEIIGGILAWRDITERKKVEQAVREYSDELREYSEKLETRVMERTEELVNLQRRLVDNVEAERLWVSQELHDGPMQEIYALIYELSFLEDAPDGSDWKAEITALQDKLKQINENLRSVTRELRPTALTPFGLEKAIREHGERFDEEHPELQITLNLMEDDTLLPEHVRLTLFRIYQTALINVIRHAEAKNISVNFSFDKEQIILEIQDDGKGFEVPKRIRTLARRGHFGLAGAVERAEAIGGKLEVDSAPGKGTQLRVIVPVVRENGAEPLTGVVSP